MSCAPETPNKNAAESEAKENMVLIDSSYHPRQVEIQLKEGDTFEILQSLPLDSGTWIVLVEDLAQQFGAVKNDSMFLQTIGFPSAGTYILEDLEVIKQMQKEWRVRYLKSDCCTPDFNLNFYQNNHLKLSLGVGLGKKLVGFQTVEYGWTPITDEKSIQKFFGSFKELEVHKD